MIVEPVLLLHLTYTPTRAQIGEGCLFVSGSTRYRRGGGRRLLASVWQGRGTTLQPVRSSMIIDIVRFDSPVTTGRPPTCSLMTDFRWAPQNREIILKITNKWIYEQEASSREYAFRARLCWILISRPLPGFLSLPLKSTLRRRMEIDFGLLESVGG